jgi:hypothetical protein
MGKNPPIAISSIRSYIYVCKFVSSIYQCQQNNRKTVFVIEKLGTAIWRGLNLHVFSVDGTNASREVPQVPKVITDLRQSCPHFLTCEPTYTSYHHSEQHFSLLRLTSMLLLLIVCYKTNGAAYLMEIISGFLSCAVLEGTEHHGQCEHRTL